MSHSVALLQYLQECKFGNPAKDLRLKIDTNVALYFVRGERPKIVRLPVISGAVMTN